MAKKISIKTMVSLTIIALLMVGLVVLGISDLTPQSTLLSKPVAPSILN